MRIAVLGCGNMGRALIEGLIARRGSPVSVWAYDKRAEATNGLRGAEIRPPEEWFAGKEVPEVVVVAVKPHDVEAALAPLGGKRASHCLWVSIAAGVPLARLGELLDYSARIVRVMPNTPALIGEGVSAYAVGEHCTQEDAKKVELILGACGRVVAVPEKLMDAVTGLSGSGPAYVFLFIEGLIEGGVTAGLPYATARELAVQTVVGAARMVQEGGDPPAELKARVMSPAGTTVSGLRELEKRSFKYALIEAVQAASRRAVELGRA